MDQICSSNLLNFKFLQYALSVLRNGPLWFSCCWHVTILLPNATQFRRIVIAPRPDSWYVPYGILMVQISEGLVWLCFVIGCFTAYKLRQQLRKVAATENSQGSAYLRIRRTLQKRIGKF